MYYTENGSSWLPTNGVDVLHQIYCMCVHTWPVMWEGTGWEGQCLGEDDWL